MKTMKNFLIVAVIAFLAVSCSVVKPGYHAMKWKPYGKGLQTEKVYQDGVVWNWPWNGVRDYNMQWQTFSENISILTKDELHIDITVSVTLRPIAEELADLELEVGSDYYKNIVRSEFISLTRVVFSGYEYSVVSPKSPEIEKEVFENLVANTNGKHLEFDNYTIDHIKYPEVVTTIR